MKKVYAKLAGEKLNFFRPVYKASFVKMLSLSSIVALLSSASPLSSKTVASKKAFLISAKSPSVAFPQSVISVVDSAASSTLKDNYLTALNTVLASKVNASNDSNYANFLKNTLLEKSKPTINILAEASDLIRSIDMNAGSKKTTRKALTPRVVTGGQMTRGGELGNPLVSGNRAEGNSHDAIVYGQIAQTKADQGIAIGLTALAGKSRSDKNCIAIGSSLTDSLDEKERTVSVGDFSIAFGSKAHNYSDNAIAIGYNAQVLVQATYAIAVGPGAVSSNNDSISMGHMAHATGKSSVAIGGEYNVDQEKDYTTANADYSTALGAVSKAMEYGASAFGHRAYALAKNAISIGFYSKANGIGSIALGSDSNVKVDGGVAIGNNSVSDRAVGVLGYTFLLQRSAKNTEAQWKSTSGAVSVGDPSKNITRQIVAVAAGTEDTDAVNVAQLKSLQDYVNKGWKLSVGGANAKAVGIDSSVDFSAGSNNLTIAKGKDDNKVTFDLAKTITVDKIQIGKNTLDATGLIITGGPKITTTGIDAGNKKITGVAKGTEANDAVNFSQLEEIKTQVASSGLVVQDKQTKDITIGKGTDGNKISIANKDGKGRVISGIANGTISDASTEAVTGQQLHQFGTSIAGYFGGGAKYENGKWTAPTFKVKTVKDDGTEGEEAVYNDVAAALAGVGNSFTNIQNKITQEITNVVTKVEGDSLSWSKKDGAFVAHHAEKGTEGELVDPVNGKIMFLAKGDVSKDSTDAINGSQLFETNDKVATYLGGGAKYDEGKWTPPSFKVKIVKADGSGVEEKDYENVAAAFEGVGSSFTNIKNNISKEINNVKGDSLLWNDAANAFVARHEKSTEEKGRAVRIQENSKITSLLDGNVSKDSTDAINGSQLFETNDKVATYLGGGAKYDEGKWTAPSFKVKIVKADGSGIEEKDYENVAAAFEGVGSSFTNIKNNINKEINNVKGDSLLWNDAANAFVARHEKSTEEKGRAVRTQENSKITSLLDGNVSKGSTDAVTGNQLYSLGDKVASYFGGDAKYDNGQWTAPKFKVKTVKADGEGEDKEYKTVAEALAGVGTSITNVKNEINNVKGDSLVKWDEATKLIKIGEEKEGSKINIKNKAGGARTISGVAAGSAETDAVNFSQLQKVEKDVKEQVAASSFVQQEPETKHLTIGKETVGDKIDIANNKNEKRTLTGIKDGALSADSNEAVTGSQLFTTNQNVTTVATNIAKSFGGEAKYENGQWIAPQFTVKSLKDDGKSEEKTYSTVAEAFEGVGSSITNVQNKFTEQINNVVQKVESESFVQQDKATHSLTIGAKTQGSKINIANKDGADRTLSGLKAAEKENEAVNKGQLDASLKDLSNSLQSDDSAVVHYDKTDGENNTINYASVTFGKGKDSTPVGLHNVADGTIAQDSHDAINGSQVNTISQEVTKYLGGGSAFKDGAFTGPAYNLSKIEKNGLVTDATFQDVGKAFEGLDTNIKNVNKRIKEVSEGVAQDSLLWSDDAHAFVARHEKKQEEKGRAVAKQENSKITFLLDGTVSKDSTDAVNGGQLFETNERVSAVESQVSSIDKQVQDIAIAADGAVKYDRDKEGHKLNKISLVGVSESDPVLIDNVGDGSIEHGSKEAVNGGQLHDYTEQQIKIVLDDAKKYTDDKVGSVINDAKSYTDMKFETLSYAVEDVRKEARQAAAIGLAVANLSYDDTPGKLSVTFGSGIWRSQSAFALGAGYMSENGRMRSNLSVTSAGGHWGVGAGFRVTLN